jgi:hypothetical protein
MVKAGSAERDRLPSQILAYTVGLSFGFALSLLTQRLLSPGAASACAVRRRRPGACGGVGGFRTTRPAWGTPACGGRLADEAA